MLVFWLIGGGVLIGLELIVPGGVLAPLGLGALAVALLAWMGILDHWVGQFTAWFVASLVFIMVFRFAFQRVMPGEAIQAPFPDEDTDAFDQVVEVVETIEKGMVGRIAFRGSSWKAICYDRTLSAGERAKLFYRDGLTWVVSPLSDNPDDTQESLEGRQS